MTFILDNDYADDADPSLLKGQFEAYYRYLEAVRKRLPMSAYTFATAPWHYDPYDHQCPHDSWVESLTLQEIVSDIKPTNKRASHSLRLIGAYYDGHLELVYGQVRSYSLTLPMEFKGPPPGIMGHGDWLVDEIRLSDVGLVVHEIEFSRGGRWLIECADVECKWHQLE